MNSLLLTLVLLHGCDATTTGLALSQGAREANPLLPQHIGVNLALQASVTSLQVVGLKRLSVHHRKLAIVLTWTAVGIEASVVASNLRTIRRQQ